MMTLNTFKDFMDGARDAYLHACEKHPQYTKRLNHHTIDEVREFIADCRKFNDGKDGGDFNSILEEEVAEYIETSLLGDPYAAKRELLDCVAVLMREWERISQ